MSRRSLRIHELGYYDKEGNRTIFYKDNIQDVVRRKRRYTNNSTQISLPDVMSDSPVVVQAQEALSKPSLPWYSVFLYLVIILGFLMMRYSTNRTIESVTMEYMSSNLNLQMEASKLRENMKVLQNKIDPQAYSLRDFALEILGAQVVYHRTSRTYRQQTRHNPNCRFKTSRNTPCGIFRGQTYPLVTGHCWTMEGRVGQVFIELAENIHISHVTIAHITKEQSPNGQIYSAPRKFSVYGLKAFNGEMLKLGAFEYSDDGGSFQTFKIQDHADEVFRFVHLAIESNYGNPEYTCLYNFRVHGRVPGKF